MLQPSTSAVKKRVGHPGGVGLQVGSKLAGCVYGHSGEKEVLPLVMEA